MFTNSLIVKFLLKCIALYLVFILLGSVPVINSAIGNIFRNINNTRFHGLLENTKVEFQKTRKSAFDTNIYIRYSNDKQWNFAEYKLDSWYIGFIPNALFFSLLLATTFITTKRKFWTLFAGLILINVLAFGVLFIRIYILKIQVQSTLGDFTNTFFDKTIIYLHNNLAVYSWINFVLPVFAWTIVTFQKKMLNPLIQNNYSKL